MIFHCRQPLNNTEVWKLRPKSLGRLIHVKEPQEKDYSGTTDAQQELPGSGASLPAVRELSREKTMGMELTWERLKAGA